MRLLAHDSESFLIAPGRLAPPLVCISYCEPQQEPTLYHVRGGEGQQIWLDALRDPDTILIGHNVTYDLAVLVDSFVGGAKEVALRAVFDALEAGRIRDTLTRQKIFHIRKGDLQYLKKGSLSLAGLSALYLGEEMKKGEDTWRLRYAELANVPLREWPNEASHYAKHDARQTLRVFLAQDELFTKMKYQGREPHSCPDECFQLKAAWALHLMSAWGIRTDPGKVAKLELELTGEIESYTGELQNTFQDGEPLIRPDETQNMTALRARIVAAYKALGGEPPQTDGGDISTSKETIEAVVNQDPVLRMVHERKHSEKILKTFLKPAKHGTVHPITAGFNPLLATTRTSCKSPNLQNLPKKAGVRECFVPRKGFVFCDADYTTLEMRTFAQIMYELHLPDILRQALIKDMDPHSMLGATLLGTSYEDFVARRKGGDNDVESIRDQAKSGNFAFMGGLGPPKFKQYVHQFGIEITLDRSKQIKAGWMDTWQAQGYFQWINSLMNEVTNTADIPIRIHGGGTLIRGACRYTVGANTPFQSRAARGAKEALWRLSRETYLDRSSDLFGSRLVNFIHDETMTEVPIEHAAPAAARVTTIMVEAMESVTPDVPQKAPAKLMHCWDKRAKPVLDDEGNLIPWDAGEEGP